MVERYRPRSSVALAAGPSMKDIISKIEDHNVSGPEAYAPKQHQLTVPVTEPTVEEEIGEQVAEVLVQDPTVNKDTVSIIHDHFIKEGENIARAMEIQAEQYDKKAQHFRQLAEDARKSAKVQAEAAAKHEGRMKQIKTLLTETD